MKLCLLICVVTACSSGSVSFQQEKGDEKTVIDDDDHSLQVAKHTQSINPVKTDRPLDILMVIDSSGSMSNAHENLSANLNSLLENVKGSDWRIVITTATFTDCLRAVIDKGDEGYEQTFIDTIDKLKNENLSHEEQYLSNREDTVRMATKALPDEVNGSLQYRLPLRSLGYEIDVDAYSNLVRRDEQDEQDKQDDSLLKLRPTWCTGDINHKGNGEDSPRAQWLRDGSMLAILLITDEDAFSGDEGTQQEITEPPSPVTGYPHCGCKSDDPVRSCKCIDDLWQRIAKHRTPHVTAKIYGLLYDELSKFYLGWRSEKENEELFDMTAWVSTTNNENIKEATDKNNFTGILKTISTDVEKQMGKTYTLERVHDGKTSKVVFVYDDNKEEILPADNYQIDGQTLIFKKDPFTKNSKREIKKIKVDFSYSTSK